MFNKNSENCILIGFEYWQTVKFAVYKDENGQIFKERENRFLMDEENINIFCKPDVKEWELDY